MYEILIGLNLCKGLNFPAGFHHSSAILENFLFFFIYCVIFHMLVYYIQDVFYQYFNLEKIFYS